MLNKDAYEDISDEGSGERETNLEDIVRKTITGDGSDVPQLHLGDLHDHGNVALANGSNTPEEDTKALIDELSRSQDYAKHLESKLAQANAKLLQLENENASGYYIIGSYKV